MSEYLPIILNSHNSKHKLDDDTRSTWSLANNKLKNNAVPLLRQTEWGLVQGCTNPRSQSPWQVDSVWWVLGIELASHHPSGAKNSDVDSQTSGKFVHLWATIQCSPHLAQHTGISKLAAANAETLPTQHTTYRIIYEDHGVTLTLLMELTDNQPMAACQWLLVRDSTHV